MESFNSPESFSADTLSSAIDLSASQFFLAHAPEKIAGLQGGTHNGNGSGIPTLVEDIKATVISSVGTKYDEVKNAIADDLISDPQLNFSAAISPLADEVMGVLTPPKGATDQSNAHASSQNSLISEALSIAADSLTAFKGSTDFLDDMAMAFGEGLLASQAISAVDSLLSGEADVSLQVAKIENPGTIAAFAAATNTIYLSESFLTQHAENPNHVANVVLEEWGHYLDTVLNDNDSKGDEGEIFMSLVKGFSFDLDALQSEDDQAALAINGNTIMAEQAFETISLPTRWVIYRSVRGSILAFKRDATVSALTDVYFHNAGEPQGRLIENLQSPINIFNGQFSVTTRVNNTKLETRLDGTVGFRSGFIEPRLSVNTPSWVRIQ
ncbi:MAG: hypothetical protein WBC73_07570 [Phormidesmis sp.]